MLLLAAAVPLPSPAPHTAARQKPGSAAEQRILRPAHAQPQDQAGSQRRTAGIGSAHADATDDGCRKR